MKNKKKKIRVHSSEVLLGLTKVETLKDFTYADLIRLLKRRAFGIAFLVFALPSALPLSVVPGFSTLFGIPILFFSLQMIFAKKTLYLPKFIAKRQIPQKKLSQVIRKTAPYLKRIERMLKPRLELFTSVVADSVTGIFIAILALLLMLPIPFSNFIIAGILIIFSLALTEGDGLFILIGWLMSITLFIFIHTFITGIVKSIVGYFG